MRSMSAGQLLLLTLVVAETAAGAPPSSPAAMEAVADATGAALQADAARALTRLREVAPGLFRGPEEQFRTCMEQRFGHGSWKPPVSRISDAFALRVLRAYQAYWRAALLRPAARQHEEAKLLAALRRVLSRDDLPDMDALEPALAARLRVPGYYSLQGMTGPLRELMLWSKEDAREIRVELPEGAHTTKVLVLDDFASLGWSDFATCRRRGTGGWATTDALYAVRPRYANLEDETFRVSFLGHETQHFADYARFPGLAPWELEYRAKLTELALADETRSTVLRKLTEDQGDDPASPHAYANKRVLAALRRRLGLPPDGDLDSIERPALRAAAVAEQRADSARRGQ